MRVGGVLLTALVMAPFTGCADQGQATHVTSGVTGQVLLGPRCPVEMAGDPCPDQPAAGARVTVTVQLAGELNPDGEVVARTTTDAEGRYRVAVPPGRYVVTADAGMSCELVATPVAASSYAKADIPCDTGIR